MRAPLEDGDLTRLILFSSPDQHYGDSSLRLVAESVARLLKAHESLRADAIRLTETAVRTADRYAETVDRQIAQLAALDVKCARQKTEYDALRKGVALLSQYCANRRDSYPTYLEDSRCALNELYDVIGKLDALLKASA